LCGWNGIRGGGIAHNHCWCGGLGAMELLINTVGVVDSGAMEWEERAME